MSFFKREQKRLALRNSKSNLENLYHKSELKLRRVSKTGNESELKKAMKEHGKYEYALLYQNTPEYRNKRRRK